MSEIDLSLHYRQSRALLTKATEVLYGGAAGGGKMVSCKHFMLGWSTKIGKRFPVIKTAGEYKAGDYLIGSDGKPTRIISISDREYRPFYRITFDDGSQVDASDNHTWHVVDNAVRGGFKERGKFWCNLTTEDILQKGLRYRDQNRFATPVMSGPHDDESLHDAPVPAYVLGYWFGNGCKQASTMTCHLEDMGEIRRLLERASKGTSLTYKERHYETDTLRGKILANGWSRMLNEIGWPHEPGHARQTFDKSKCHLDWRLWKAKDRLALLQGLLDSDGHATYRGDIEFCSTDRELARLVHGLMQSLGAKPTTIKWYPQCGKGSKPVTRFTCTLTNEYHLNFLSLKRKRNRLKIGHTPRSFRRYITDIEPIGYDEGVCFQVAAPDSLYVVGDNYVVTHNSHLMRAASVIWCSEIKGLQVYLFRRLSDDLFKNHMTGPGSFPDMLAPWVDAKLAKWSGAKNFWEFWNGAKIWLCHCQYEKDVIKYQGAEINVLCKALGSRVLMADGSYRAIEDLAVGDMLQTLVGPRRVNKVYPRRLAECVRVTTPYGSEVHPVTHPILTPWGWLSYEDLCASARLTSLLAQFSERASGIFHNPYASLDTHNQGQMSDDGWLQEPIAPPLLGGISYDQGDDKNYYVASGRTPQEYPLLERLSFPSMLYEPHLLSETSASEGGPGSVYEAYQGILQGRVPRLGWLCGSSLLQPLEHALMTEFYEGTDTFLEYLSGIRAKVSQRDAVHALLHYSELYARHVGLYPPFLPNGFLSGCLLSALQGSQGCYRSYPDSCDELLRAVRLADREFHVQLSGGVVELTHPALKIVGGQEPFPGYTRPCYSTFSHPYRTGELHVSDALSVRQCFAEVVSDSWVTDIEVDDANHYITGNALVNQNCLDEGTHFTPTMYRFLRGRVRMGGVVVPEKYKGCFPRILVGTNPGGIGHGFFKKEFVDLAPPMTITKMPKTEGGMRRQYIPAKLTDNPTLMETDPDYADRLHALGDPTLVRAMLEGDWNIVAGGALDDVWTPKLILPRFPIPDNWSLNRSFDWGSTHPFSVGWWAKANGETVVLPGGKEFTPKAGSIIRFAEWYGAEDLHENKGLRIGPIEIAEGILARERAMIAGGWITRMPEKGPADGQIYGVNDSETDTVAKRMESVGVKWVKADKRPGSRINNLQLVRQRMSAVKDGTDNPGIYFMENCRAAITLLPILPRDPLDPEDVDTKALDHVFDDVKYECAYLAKQYATDLKILLPR